MGDGWNQEDCAAEHKLSLACLCWDVLATTHTYTARSIAVIPTSAIFRHYATPHGNGNWQSW